MKISRERRTEIRHRLGLNRDGGRLSRDICPGGVNCIIEPVVAGVAADHLDGSSSGSTLKHSPRKLDTSTDTTDAASEELRRHAMFAIFVPAIEGSASILDKTFTTQMHI